MKSKTNANRALVAEKAKLTKLFTLLTILTLGIINVWANQTDLIPGKTLPDMPTASLNMATQSTFTPDANGWVVFDPYAEVANLSTVPSWWGHTAKATQGQEVTSDALTTLNPTAPFAAKNTTHFRINTGNAAAIRFTGAEAISLLVHPRSSSSGKEICATLFSYDSEADPAQVKVGDEKKTSSSNFHEFLFSGLTTSTTYVLYVYNNGTSQNGCLAEVAIKKHVNVDGPFAITYDKNDEGASGTMTDSNSPYAKNTTVTVLGNSFTAPTGKVFVEWNTKADGSGDPYDAGDTFSATEDVTLYAQWDYPATGTGTITYTLTKGAATVSAAIAGVSTLSSSSTAFSASTISISSSNSKDGYCGQITGHAADFSASQYVALQFTVADGYTFNPSSVAMTVFANSTSNMKMKLVFTDGVTSVESEELACASSADSDIEFASGAFTGKKFVGNVDVVLYQWGVTSKRTYVKSPVTITGTVAAAAPKYDVVFSNGGEGTGSMATLKYEAGEQVTLPDCGYTPASGREFDGWTSSDVTISAGKFTMPSNNVTITATWRDEAVKYTVTYDVNGGSSATPTEASKAAGAEFTLAAAPSRDGYRFDGWLCSADGLVKDAEANYTMTAAATTFTAQWTQLFTVTYYNGAVSLGTEQVANGGSPANYASFQTLPLASFVGWYSDQELNTAIADFAALTISANTPIYGKWNKAYAVTIDLAAEAAGDKTAINDFFASKGYASTIGGSGGYDTNASGYLGYKFKNNGDEILFNLQNGKIADIAFMYIETNFKIYVDGVEFETVTNKSTSATPLVKYVYANGADKLVRIVNGSANSKTSVINKIAIHDPYVVTYDATTNGGDAVTPGSATYIGTALTLPAASKGSDTFIGWFDAETGGNKIGEADDSYTPTASITLYAQFESISTDARLSAITFSSAAGTLSPAFSMEVTEYTYTMPYGTAAIPTITGATAHHANAQAPIIGDAATAWGESQTIQGVAESGDKKTYTVTMLKAPKDGVSIIKVATTGGTNKTVTGLYAGDGDVNLSSSKKMDNGKYIGFILNGTTLQTGDRINVHTTEAASTGGSHIIFYDNMTDKNELYETGEIGGTGDNIFTINAEMEGKATAYVYRSNADAAHQWNGYVDFIEVTRPMNPMLTAITINGEAGVIDESLKTVAVELQPGYDLAALTINTTIVSNTDEALVVKTVESNGGAWVIGDNTYRLTDKDGDYTDYTVTLSVGEVKHTVTFDAQGGSAVDPQQVVDGGNPAVPTAPTKDDYIFQGWSETTDGAVVDVTSFTITAPKTFYAIWVSDGAIKLLDGSTVNHTNFITGVTADETVEFQGNTVNYAKFSGTVSGVNGVKDLTRVIAYNATTTQTKIQISAHNNSTNARSILVKGVVEGSTDVTDIATVALGNKEDKVTEYYEFNNVANRTIYIIVPNSAGDVFFTQVKVIESGAALPMAGQAGYELNLNKGRFLGQQTNSIVFEGLNVEKIAADYQPTSSTVGRFWLETSISFTVASNVTMSLTAANNKTYYVTKDAAGTDNETSKTGVSEFALTAGTWYITAGAEDMQFTNIAFSAPKCEAPVFSGALADIELCAGDPFSTAFDGTATVGDGGTVTYKWYAEGADETDPAAVLGTNATYTPNAEGNYYVIATNSLSGFADNSTKSALVKITQFAAAVITTAPENQRDNVGETVTLSVAASGKNLSYEWFTCDDETGANPVAIVPAETNASLTVTVAVGVQWYKVVVSSDCGSAEAVAKVSEFTPTTPQDVTAATTWDWTNSAWPSTGTIEFANQTDEQLLADVDAAVPNNADFHSDMLYGIGQYVWRSGNKFFQGTQIRFNTTVEGRVRVHFRSTGSGKNVQVTINGTVAGSGAAWQWTNYVYVPAGGVTIVCAGMAGNETGLTRIDKIEFQTPTYKRDASTGDDWMAPGELGTVCYPEGLVATGGDMYELVGKNSDGKIVFATVDNNELEPGKPYLFQAKSNRMVFYATDATPVGSPDNTGAMKGTFVNTTITDLTNVYYFAGHALWDCSDLTSLEVKANRAYVKMDEVGSASPSPAPGRRYITMDTHGKNTTTGVGELNANEAPVKMIIDGKMFILRGEKLYDATGRLVK